MRKKVNKFYVYTDSIGLGTRPSIKRYNVVYVTSKTSERVFARHRGKMVSFHISHLNVGFCGPFETKQEAKKIFQKNYPTGMIKEKL